MRFLFVTSISVLVLTCYKAIGGGVKVVSQLVDQRDRVVEVVLGFVIVDVPSVVREPTVDT
jgi:hypothetical protein